MKCRCVSAMGVGVATSARTPAGPLSADRRPFLAHHIALRVYPSAFGMSSLAGAIRAARADKKIPPSLRGPITAVLTQLDRIKARLRHTSRPL